MSRDESAISVLVYSEVSEMLNSMPVLEQADQCLLDYKHLIARC